MVVKANHKFHKKGKIRHGKDNVIELVQPGEFKDQLTEVLRQGAQALVLQAVEAEFAVFLENHSTEKPQDGRESWMEKISCQRSFLVSNFPTVGKSLTMMKRLLLDIFKKYSTYKP
jgi:hypothetical protein